MLALIRTISGLIAYILALIEISIGVYNLFFFHSGFAPFIDIAWGVGFGLYGWWAIGGWFGLPKPNKVKSMSFAAADVSVLINNAIAYARAGQYQEAQEYCYRAEDRIEHWRTLNALDESYELLWIDQIERIRTYLAKKTLRIGTNS